MLVLHNQVSEIYQGLQTSLRELSEKMVCAEGRIERYWGLTEKDKDVTVIEDPSLCRENHVVARKPTGT